MFGNLSATEIIIIFLVILIFFGAKRLPELGNSLGKGIREFKRSLSDIKSDIDHSGKSANNVSENKEEKKS